MELKPYRELYERLSDGRNSQINLIAKEIKRLQVEANRQENRDLLKEIYDQYKVAEKGITLQEFRIGVHEGRL